ncbi:MAG: sulfurtransferase TusA family protein [Deltaproteobacteria bacterium]|uniref:Sulfurtransferase TusA family protein n=1 Tax=Candidatus Zymogenus saltonus TaxID=2844893 RepID=A0A9D8KAG1_9DELT|nr:sulfurtransferase TusA family protein [Candidatus Zymogenus saltonus]
MADKKEKTIDARGLSCPQPVIMTRNAIKGMEGGNVKVLVDTMTQVYNVSRSAEKLGWGAEYSEAEGEFQISLKK